MNFGEPKLPFERMPEFIKHSAGSCSVLPYCKDDQINHQKRNVNQRSRRRNTIKQNSRTGNPNSMISLELIKVKQSRITRAVPPLPDKFLAECGCREMQNRLVAGSEKQAPDCTRRLLLRETIYHYQDFRPSVSLVRVVRETPEAGGSCFAAKLPLASWICPHCPPNCCCIRAGGARGDELVAS